MLLDYQNPEHLKYRVFDKHGNQLNRVIRYNTQTKEVTLIIPGSYALDEKGYFVEENGDKK